MTTVWTNAICKILFPFESHEREYGGSNPMVLEQSNDENNERGVDEREIQHSIGNFEMS